MVPQERIALWGGCVEVVWCGYAGPDVLKMIIPPDMVVSVYLSILISTPAHSSLHYCKCVAREHISVSRIRVVCGPTLVGKHVLWTM
jgi:hypothetical protein